MFLTQTFYTFKPMIPRRVQIALRRKLAAYKRPKYANVWPIDPSAATPPPGWQGWSGGKQFALVLSHDVDTLTGYKNVLRLAELEENLGFRSTFNFVPERYGRISPDLLDELRGRGFGVAVHGLKHDGKLFLSKRIFNRQAKRINEYLKEWKTEGFTSPSMHRNLDWMTALNIRYSTSTFDTDPFEPQPDGAGTIFPFPVYKNGARTPAFIEFPYTLPQDSTLFIILQEKTIDIWKRKLDWIAEKGGMALLNTHPDYMDFIGDGRNDFLYPVRHYLGLLDHLRNRYAGQYLHALTADLADLCWQRHCPPSTGSDSPLPGLKHRGPSTRPSTRTLHVAMLSYSFYESDNRVRRYAETLVRRGDHVDVFSLRRPGQSGYNELNGVTVHRVQERTRDEKHKREYLTRILKFYLRSALLLTRSHLKRPYDLIHVHSVPDFEVFAALVPKLLGARIILDIHDIVPELYANKFNVSRESRIFKLLVLIEKLSTRFADHVIISNDLWRETLVARSTHNGKCTAIMNYPDNSLFFKEPTPRDEERLVFLYPGTLNAHQGLDIAVRAFDLIKDQIPNAEFHIYGEGPARKDLEAMVIRYGLQGRVFLYDSVPLDEIAGIMARADVGVIPKRNDSFGGEAFSTKTLEFMSLGVPIIVSRTTIDQRHFNDSVVRFFDPENVDDLAQAMIAMAGDKSLRDEQAVRAQEFSARYNWLFKKHLYLDMVDGLCRK